MALRDSLNRIGRFIGVLQPGPPPMPLYDQNGYPIDDGAYYGNGAYDQGPYDGGSYDGGSYAGGGYPPQRGPGGQRNYPQEEYYAQQQPRPPQMQRGVHPEQAAPPQPASIFGNNQRSRRPPDNVVQMPRAEDAAPQRGNKHSEIIICVRDLEDCQEIINALLDAKSVFINMEPMDDMQVQRVIDMLGGASFALRGTMAKISHRTYLLAPSSVDVVNNQGPSSAFRGSDFRSMRR